MWKTDKKKTKTGKKMTKIYENSEKLSNNGDMGKMWKMEKN